MAELGYLPPTPPQSGTPPTQPLPPGREVAEGMEKFFDRALQTLRRYLPDVGDDKDTNEVDAWYLYHPLRNLGQLAIDGEEWARDLFFRSLKYCIRAAHHFDHIWPIQYDVRDFTVRTATRTDHEHGQTDVGGFYAYVMLQAFELTGEVRYLDEARTAIDAARGMRFELASPAAPFTRSRANPSACSAITLSRRGKPPASARAAFNLPAAKPARR